ncbi:MAG: AAA family ATPase, partial [Candidatus Aenigmarchaeota archaeon]|nr:AAA family ATPase [Candidatus Aenigmarchaeota archaeon]
RLERSRKKKQELESLIEKFKDFNKKRLRKQELSEKLEKIDFEISEHSKKIEDRDIKKIRGEFTKIVSRVSELMTRVRGLTDIIKEKEERKEEYKENLDKIKKQKEDIENLEKIIKDLKIFGSSLEKTQSQLRENFIDTVNYTMDQIWSDIYPYEDFMSSRLAIKDRDYILQVQRESGKWVDVEGIVSGGERSIASLVLRMAFSTVLAPQLKWLVLDEPTHNLDSRAIDDLSETLRTKVGDFAEQLFLITHEKRLENAVTGNLYKLFRHRGTSDVTEIKKVN